jgi:hypothetical protein
VAASPQGTGVSEAKIPHSDVHLKQYQLMRRKWSTALVASIHKQAALRKRLSERYAKGSSTTTAEQSATNASAPATPASESASATLVLEPTHRASDVASGGDSDGPTAGDHAMAGDVEVRELLQDAFKEFDPDGKGYVLGKDLAGIMCAAASRRMSDAGVAGTPPDDATLTAARS